MASPPLSSRREAAEVRGTADRILDTAQALFAERGFAGCAIRDIAQGAGLNPASLYNHFPSKQALYEAVLERGMGPIFEILERAAGGEAAPADDLLEELVNHLAGTPTLARLIQHEVLAGGEHLARLAGRWLRPMYARGIAALQRSPDLGGFESQELPLLLTTYHHLIIGHFAMAGALGEVLGEDLLSPAAVERHARFLRKLTGRLFQLDAEARREGESPMRSRT